MTILTLLDYAAAIVFAASGAMVASRAQLDIVGFAFIACLTAVGGGTVRDVLLDRNPVFWMGDPMPILLATGVAVLVFFTAHLVESRLRWVVWLDTFALAIAVPAGTGAAMELGHGPVIVVLMGMATGSLGGLMRDVVCNEVPLVLTQGELYISCAMAGAITAVVMVWFGLLSGTGPAGLRRGHLGDPCWLPGLWLAPAGLPSAPATALSKTSGISPARALRPCGTLAMLGRARWRAQRARHRAGRFGSCPKRNTCHTWVLPRLLLILDLLPQQDQHHRAEDCADQPGQHAHHRKKRAQHQTADQRPGNADGDSGDEIRFDPHDPRGDQPRRRTDDDQEHNRHSCLSFCPVKGPSAASGTAR